MNGKTEKHKSRPLLRRHADSGSSVRVKDLFVGASRESSQKRILFWDRLLANWQREIDLLCSESFSSTAELKARMAGLVAERYGFASVAESPKDREVLEQLLFLLENLPEFEELFAKCQIAGLPS